MFIKEHMSANDINFKKYSNNNIRTWVIDTLNNHGFDSKYIMKKIEGFVSSTNKITDPDKLQEMVHDQINQISSVRSLYYCLDCPDGIIALYLSLITKSNGHPAPGHIAKHILKQHAPLAKFIVYQQDQIHRGQYSGPTHPFPLFHSKPKKELSI